MALFTDGTIAAPEDLAAHDSSILDVASTEGIDLTNKLSLAQDDLALDLTSLIAAGDSLANIVVTSALRLWHAFHSLELVYRDAYANQLNDRYAARRDQFALLAIAAADKLIQLGLGMAANPVPKAGPAQLTFVPGQLPGATYYVCTSWLSADHTEGAAGDYSAITVPDNNILCVQPAANPPANAAAWNVFAGLTPDTISRQNSSPLPLGPSWLQLVAVSTGGVPPGTGQVADFIRGVARVLQRG